LDLFDIIPVIIKQKMVYPKGFTNNGHPLCPWAVFFPTMNKTQTPNAKIKN